MIRKWLALGITMAIGLIACDKEDRSPTQPEGKDGKGSARIALPKLPAGYLADSGQKALFSLTITGNGMDPIMKSWYLSPDRPQPILVAGIPVGERHFYGRLIRIDANTGDTAVTHEGEDSAYIERGATADVHLYLRAGGFGSAHVCVEVEGWPVDSTCIPPPPPPVLNVEGCYFLQIKASDSLLKASLRILRNDTSLFGTLTWGDGQVDTATGILRWDGVVYLGWQGRADFIYKAQVDSSGTLYGSLRDSVRNVYSDFARAFPTSCTTPPPPPQPLPKVAGCYALVVTKAGPKEDSLFKGKLTLTQRDSLVSAVLEWRSGVKDTAVGFVYPGGTLAIGTAGGSQFSLKAMYDSLSGITQGYFYEAARGIYGPAEAAPIACATPIPPNETAKFDSVLCWKVAQKTLDGRAMQGTLWAGWAGASLTAWFQWDWNQAGFAMDNGTTPVSTGVLYLYGTLPGGFAHPAKNAIERGHYKARLSAAGALGSGAAYARANPGDFIADDKFAEWAGEPYACPDQARSTLAKLRKP